MIGGTAGHTHNYCVIGFAKDGKELFSVVVEAIDESDARLIAGAEMRATPHGAAVWTQATRLEVKRER